MPEFKGTQMNFYQLMLLLKYGEHGDKSLTPAIYRDTELALAKWQSEASESREFRLTFYPDRDPDGVEKIPQRLHILRATGQLWKIVDRYNEMLPRYDMTKDVTEDVFNLFWDNLGRLELP